jgi:hypothetical protein
LSRALQQLDENPPDVERDLTIYLLAPKPDAFARLDAHHDDPDRHQQDDAARRLAVMVCCSGCLVSGYRA